MSNHPMLWDILADRPAEKGEICSWMYIKKVLEDHRPCFANGVPWNTIEVHGHAPPCAEGVAADAARCWESFLVEACGNDGGFKHFVDVAGL